MIAALLLALSWAATAGPPKPDWCADPAADPERGEVLAGLAGCAACHTSDAGEGPFDGAPYAGGHRIDTPWGVFVGTNLTPDDEHGLGGWSCADFERAMRRGRNPDGRHYYPSFPYPSFTQLTDADLRDLWAYLATLDAVPRPNEPHEVVKGYRARGLLTWWKLIAFSPGPHRAPPRATDAEALGAYLGEAVGHCGACHTPRTGLGVSKRRWTLAGSSLPPEPGPNITPHDDGIGGWSRDDVITFFELGMTPEGDFVGGHMASVVDEGTAQLTAAEREALVDWLAAIPPRPDAPD